MRQELLDPIRDKTTLAAVVEPMEEVYRRHEAGRANSELLTQLGRLVGKPVSAVDVDAG